MHRLLLALPLCVVLSACRSTPSGSDSGPIPVDATMPVDAFAPVDAPTPRFPATCDPHTFVLTSDGSSYTFDGTQRDPVLTLCQGVTYTFDLSAISTDHPLEILSGATSLLVIRQGTTGTYRAPTAAPFPMAYVCMVHGFGATIVTVAP